MRPVAAPVAVTFVAACLLAGWAARVADPRPITLLILGGWLLFVDADDIRRAWQDVVRERWSD